MKFRRFCSGIFLVGKLQGRGWSSSHSLKGALNVLPVMVSRGVIPGTWSPADEQPHFEAIFEAHTVKSESGGFAHSCSSRSCALRAVARLEAAHRRLISQVIKVLRPHVRTSRLFDSNLALLQETLVDWVDVSLHQCSLLHSSEALVCF